MIDNSSYRSHYTPADPAALARRPDTAGPLAVATPTTRRLADASISVNTRRGLRRRAASAGTTDGRQRQSSVGWFVGGIFLPVIMPIVAHVTTPQPPVDTVLQYSGDDARCYSTGYSDAASGKRKKGAWIGSATAIGLFVVLVATAADDLNSY